MIELNALAEQNYENCIERGRIRRFMMHYECAEGISQEVQEFVDSSEFKKSEHLPAYTEAQEELADILICAITELHRRNVNIEQIIKDKINFNLRRNGNKET